MVGQVKDDIKDKGLSADEVYAVLHRGVRPRSLIHLLCQCLSEETLKAVGPFYLVAMSGKIKYRGLHHPPL